MARPKKNLNEKNAIERIDEAFWKELSERKYEDITIKRLTIGAGVNRNTIYYYYENIDDIAKQAFERFANSGVSDFITSFAFDFNFNSIKENTMVIQAWKKTRLIARGDSAFLRNLFKENLIKNWCEKFGINLDQITPEDQITLNFIFSGLISVIESLCDQEDPSVIAHILKTDVGIGAIASLKKIAWK